MEMKKLGLPLIVAGALAVFGGGSVKAADLPIPVHSTLDGVITHVDHKNLKMNFKLSNGVNYHVNAGHAKVKVNGYRGDFDELRSGEHVRVFSHGMNILNRGMDAYEIDAKTPHRYQASSRYYHYGAGRHYGHQRYAYQYHR